jgi:N-acetylneuraminic acid mutarotase
MRPIYKKLIKIGAIVLGGFFILYLILMGPELWRSYKWQKAVDDYEEAMRKPYKEDIYGGKTPEETWQMFLDALKKGDIDLASKYYDVEHQENGKIKLEELKNSAKLQNWIRELETLEKDQNQSSQNRAYYSYRYYDKQTQRYLWSTTIFYLNPYTQVWKILY